MKFNDFQKYKHDTVGKFPFIQQFITPMSDDSLSDSNNTEVLHAIHQSFINMVRTSRTSLIQNLNQNLILVIVKENSKKLFLTQFEGINLRSESNEGSMIYYYSLDENPINHLFNMGVILSALPIKEINIDKEIQTETTTSLTDLFTSRNLSWT